MRYALICDDEVVNVILWDGEEEYTPAESYEIIPVTEEVGIGWKRGESGWIVPPEPVFEVPEEDPTVLQAKLTAVEELKAIGVSEATARAILGLPKN